MPSAAPMLLGILDHHLTGENETSPMRPYLTLAGLLILACDASAANRAGTDYLVPRFGVGQTYSNVFSIMISVKADGYDETARRNGGSADYQVLSASPSVWHFLNDWRYDG